jgi:O-6-methylguanine DNA methyltransferase
LRRALAGVLKVAAAIPLGYVTSYGNIAKASNADARDVGQVMATNPLYPIVPCHRVVGADLSLVGYFGSKAPEALRAKLDRLSKEARGFKAEQDVLVEGRPLRVYPVEWAIDRAQKRGRADDRQRSLFE